MIEILEKISKFFFVFWPFRASSYMPPSARENNIFSSLPLGSVPPSIGVDWRYESKIFGYLFKMTLYVNTFGFQRYLMYSIYYFSLYNQTFYFRMILFLNTKKSYWKLSRGFYIISNYSYL